MIRINRGPEPPELASARRARLAAAVKAYNRQGPGSRELINLLDGYNARAIKDALYQAQHKKCAWCERRQSYSSSPVEHYRPKAGAARHDRGTPAQVDHGHYWWLTWTWANLLFSCPRCNDQGHKGNFFPLAPGSPPLRPPKHPHRGRRDARFFDSSGELPLLLDPATDDPLDHIVWKPLQRALERRDWKWMPSGLTPRGTATIAILRLAELADELEHYLRLAVLPSLEEIEAHIAAERSHEAAARWQALLADTLAPSSPLAAASWCALEVWMPAARRTQLGLNAPVRPTGA
jgi:hypothetical protein